MSFLRLEGLVKKFGDFTAVERVDLDVEKGEFISLLGPSGCGKTTTLQMIAGFVDPTEGKIFINGQDVTQVKPSNRNLGIVFQSYALFPHMTVADNVAFGLQMRGIGKQESNERVKETLEMVHLGDFSHRFPRELSGGQQQRVALARALVIRPEVLLLDEPLSALDAKIREDMQIELRGIQRKLGTTTILVTHDQGEAMAMSDRIAVMHQGRLAQVDRPYEAYERPSDSFVTKFLGKSNMFDGTSKGASDGLVAFDVSGVEFLAREANIENGAQVHVSVRPEKIKLVKAGAGQIDGTVTAQIFLGDQWVFQIETPLGLMDVVTQNTGGRQVEEGDKIGLNWSPDEVRILAREATQ